MHSLVGLRIVLPRALRSVTAVTVRRYFRKADRFASIYRLPGCSAAIADKIALKHKSHRGVTKTDLACLLEKLRVIAKPKPSDKELLKGVEEVMEKIKNQE